MSSTICLFGSFDPDYSRNRILIKGLTKHKINVVQCQVGGKWLSKFNNLKKVLDVSPYISTILVGFPGWWDLPIAFILGKFYRKQVVFDVFTPLHETYVIDRKQVRVTWIYYLIDWINMKLADVVITDTKTHLALYQKKYGLNKKKGVVVYVGSDNEIFFPTKVRIKTDVLFYGSYQPLQGVENIIYAASKLPSVKFTLIGKGQTLESNKTLAKDLKIKNIKFVEWIELTKLAEEINQAKIMLGIFGSSQKALSVIPNKVFDAIACGKPLVTKKTSAIKEFFISGNNSWLVDDKEELIKAIKILLEDEKLRKKVAINGYKLYKDKLKPEDIVRPLIRLI